MNDELLKGFVEIVSPEGVTGDVVSPADAHALTVVANFCNQHGVPISVTSGAPSTPGGAPERGGIILSVHRLAEIQVAAAGLTVRAGAGATVAQVRSSVASYKLAVVGLDAETTTRSASICSALPPVVTAVRTATSTSAWCCRTRHQIGRAHV